MAFEKKDVNKQRKEQLTSLVLVLLNVFLFLMKAAGAMLFGSVALLSDAINSFMDIISYTVVFLSLRVSAKSADEGHPFGHHRAQPLAAFLIAVLTAILGFEILRLSVEKIVTGNIQLIAVPVMAILLITIVTKTLMWLFAHRVSRETNSPALEATAIDSRNDVFIDVIAIAGVFLAGEGYKVFDAVAALIIGIYVLKSAYDLAMKNTKYLMGKSPGKRTMAEIEDKVNSIKGTIRINEIRAHYIGNYAQVEIRIAIDKKKSLEEAHMLGHDIEKKVKEIQKVSECTVHIDPE